MVASKYGVHNTFTSSSEGMDMSMCLILTFAALLCTLIGCGLLLCCIRLSTEREHRRSAGAACNADPENSVNSATPMLHQKVPIALQEA